MSFRIISTGFDDLCICPVRSAGIIAYYQHSEKRESYSVFRMNFAVIIAVSATERTEVTEEVAEGKKSGADCYAAILVNDRTTWSNCIL